MLGPRLFFRGCLNGVARGCHAFAAVGARDSVPRPCEAAKACHPVTEGDLSMLSLDQLQVVQQASIAAVRGTDSIVQRLLEMGLLEGEQIEVIGVAPLGDPIEIRLRDYRLSLRRSEAARVQVTLLP